MRGWPMEGVPNILRAVRAAQDPRSSHPICLEDCIGNSGVLGVVFTVLTRDLGLPLIDHSRILLVEAS
jgi:hypothetical protein